MGLGLTCEGIDIDYGLENGDRDLKATAILGDTKPWFIHPAGMMGLVGKQKSGFIFTLEIMKRIYTSFHNNIVRDGDLQEIADELNSNLVFINLTHH